MKDYERWTLWGMVALMAMLWLAFFAWDLENVLPLDLDERISTLECHERGGAYIDHDCASPTPYPAR